MVDLVRTLSNPQLGPELDRLRESLAKLKRKVTGHRVVVDFGPPRQGDTLEAIKSILADYPGGLQTFEIRQAVERRLGRSIPPSTVKENLASNPAFERIRRGRYRLQC